MLRPVTNPTGSAFETLARKLGGELVRAWPLTGGVSARTSALEIRGEGRLQRFVVRRPGRSAGPESLARDFDLLRALSGRGLPAPRPVLLAAEGEAFEEAALVLAYVEGETDFRGEDLRATLDGLARQLAQIHSAPVGADLRALLPDRARSVAEFVASTPPAADETIGESEIRAALSARPPPSPTNAPVLLHGDFWAGNVLWREGRIVGVIDWEDAALGDPLYDLAVSRLDMLWTYGPEALDLFTEAYLAAAPALDLSLLPCWDLTAALRPAGQISVWSDSPALMRERHRAFREQALAAYALLTR